MLFELEGHILNLDHIVRCHKNKDGLTLVLSNRELLTLKESASILLEVLQPIQNYIHREPKRRYFPDTTAEFEVLAKNLWRNGATFFNTSSAALLLGYGGFPVSSASYTVRILQNGSYEMGEKYKGVIRGVWTSDPNDGGLSVSEW
jgi:hypothetical protein